MTLGFAEFAWVAAALGLTLEPVRDSPLTRSFSLDGLVEGVRVHAHHWRGEYVHVEITAYLDPPADFVFHLRPAGLLDKLANLLGGHDVEVGEPVFDAAYEVSSAEPARGRALLIPALREVLLHWKDAAHFEVREDRVHFWTIPGSYSTMEATVLRDAVQSVAGLARATSLALSHVPPAPRLVREIEAWRAHAEQRGLALVASPLRLSGKLAGAAFAARIVPVPNAADQVELEVRFAERLPFHLHVLPATWLDFARSDAAGARTKTGDVPFDQALRVVASEPSRARAFLDDEVRAALRALHAEEGELVVRSEGLSVRTKRLVPPEAFERILERLATVAAKLQAHSGPYR